MKYRYLLLVLSNVFNRGFLFLLTPYILYIGDAKLLGEYAISITIISVLNILIGIATPSIVQRYGINAIKYSNIISLLKSKLYQYVFFASVILFIFIITFEESIINNIGLISIKPYIYLFLFVALIEVFTEINASYFLNFKNYKYFSLYNIYSSIIRVSLIITITQIYKNNLIDSIIISIIISQIVIYIISLFQIKMLFLNFNSHEHIKYQENFFKYGLMLYKAEITLLFIGVIDRFFINKFLGPEILGYFITINQIVSILTIIIILPLKQFTGPSVYTLNYSEALINIRRICNYYSLIMIILIILCISIINIHDFSDYNLKDLFVYLNLVPAFLIAQFMVGYRTLYSLPLHYNNNSTDIFYSILIGALFSTLLNFLLIPKYGIYSIPFIQISSMMLVCLTVIYFGKTIKYFIESFLLIFLSILLILIF